jgi:type IV secretion system protein VirD4
MIAVLWVLVLAVVAAKVATAEAIAHLHTPAAELPALALVFLAAAALVRWFLFPGRRLPRNRIRAMRVRVRLGLRPGPGHATGFECWMRWGRGAAYRRSRQARPSLPAWTRYCRPSEHGYQVGRAYRTHPLWVPSEENAVFIGPPRSRKSGPLARIVLRWRGPVLSTSTKPDVFRRTSGIRSLRRGPVYTISPQPGGLPSSCGWDPVPGCQDPAVATRRADAFADAIEQKGVESGDWFGRMAGEFLRALFCAAALTGGDLRTVAAWATGFEITTAQEALRRAGHDQFARDLEAMRGEARKTIETIQMSMRSAFAFIGDPQLASCVLPAEGYALDIPAFLAECGTLYLIGRKQGQHAPLGPLYAALAAEVHWQAVQAATSQPGGRLDPPLLMALDEATQICPCPVPDWTGDSSGQGITILTVAHGEAKLAERWGEHGKQAILDTAGVVIYLPGLRDTATLHTASKLTGDTAYTERGQEHSTRHSVLTDAMVRAIPRGYGLLIRSDLSPVIAHIPVIWRDPRYLWALVTGRALAAITPAAVRAPAPEPAKMPADRLPGDEFRPAMPTAAATAARHPWNRLATAAKANGDGNGSHADGASDDH